MFGVVAPGIVFSGIIKKTCIKLVLVEYIGITKKKKVIIIMQLYEVLQLPFMRFHILKLLHNSFIINNTKYQLRFFQYIQLSNYSFTNLSFDCAVHSSTIVLSTALLN